MKFSKQNLSKNLLLRIMFLIIGFFYVFSLALVFLSHIKSGLIVNDRKNNIVYKSVSTVLPQGFGFFTKNARDTIQYYYVLNDNNEWNKVNLKFSSKENLYGLSNKLKIKSDFLRELLTVYPKTNIHSTNNVSLFLNKIDENNLEFVKVKILNDEFKLCNKKMLIIRVEPLPWAWRNKIKQTQIHSKCFLINFDCE